MGWQVESEMVGRLRLKLDGGAALRRRMGTGKGALAVELACGLRVRSVCASRAISPEDDRGFTSVMAGWYKVML